MFINPVLKAAPIPADNKPAVPPAQSAQTDALNANRQKAVSENEIKLRNTLSTLFVECVKRQRVLAVKTLTKAEDLPQAQAKLTETINKIGDIFKAYYGVSTGGQITTLFGQFVGETATYAYAVREDGDRAGIVSGMHGKAEELSKLFNTLNPAWSKSGLSEALNNYAAMSVKEIDMEHTSLGKPDAQIFGATFRKSTEIAEILATGITKQYHENFKREKKVK
jgi:hypothetical protein